METVALEALKKSIEHWERVASGDDDEAIGPSECALCQQFWVRTDFSVSCLGCPVFEQTGAHGCFGTPYGIVDGIDDRLREEGTSRMESEEFIEAAEAELNFLKSLLPRPCPKCGSDNIGSAHHAATFAIPECSYDVCEDCNHQWGHT